MARKSHGELTGLIIQPGRTLVLRQDGSATGQVKYRCDASAALSLAPAIGSPHPDSPVILCHDVSITILENGIAEIVCDYLGIFRDPTDYQIEFIGNVAEEPIETHKNFVSEIGGSAASPKNKAQFDPEIGEFLCFPPDAPNDLGGVRGYLNPTSTVRVSWYTATSPNWGLYELGTISSPPGGIPTPPGSRNWIKTNWSRRDYGLIYQITEEYTASGEKGWNPLIYG